MSTSTPAAGVNTDSVISNSSKSSPCSGTSRSGQEPVHRPFHDLDKSPYIVHFHEPPSAAFAALESLEQRIYFLKHVNLLLNLRLLFLPLCVDLLETGAQNADTERGPCNGGIGQHDSLYHDTHPLTYDTQGICSGFCGPYTVL